MKMILVAAGLLLLCGCEISISKYPVGEEPVNIADEKSEWEGFWTMRSADDDDVMPVAVSAVDASNGVIKVWLWGKDDGNKRGGMAQKEYTVYLRKAGGWVLANAAFRDDKEEDANTNKPPMYAWGRLEKGARTACLWWANKRVIDELIEAGKWPAYEKADKEDVIGKLSPEHLALITSPTNRVVFDWDKPWIFVRQD